MVCTVQRLFVPPQLLLIADRLPQGARLSNFPRTTQRSPHSSGRAATPYRGATHQLTKGSTSNGPSPRGDWSEDKNGPRRDWSEGGVRRGRRPQAEFGCPRWPSLLLSRERERRTLTNTEFQRKKQQTKQTVPPAKIDGAGTVCSFVAVRAVSRIRRILERRAGRFRAAARGSPTGRASAALHPAWGFTP